MKTDRWIEGLAGPLLLVMLLWSQDACSASAERWHVVRIGDATVGSMHETERREATGWRSTESSRIVINRLESKIEISTFHEALEDERGRLRSVRQEVNTSQRTQTTRGRREGDEWLIVSGDEGSGPTRSLPIEDDLLGPRGVRERLDSLEQPGDIVSYHAFLPHLGRPGHVQAELTGFEAFGDRELRVISEKMSGMPAPMTRLIDGDGYSVVTRMPGPFGQTETVLADRAAARLADAGGELGEEVFESTLVRTGVRLPNPRSIEYLEVELHHRNPALGWPEFDSAHQTVLEERAERLVLAIERRHPRQSVSLDADAAGAIDRHLASNDLLRADQPELVELAEDIVGDERDAWQAARRLERWVSDNMSVDMGVALAPSDEILEQRRGTCTEYAILLTALARAAGIPARYVGGYVYAHGMFGGHAWTEVRIGDRWLALDAAIPADGPADAARIAFVWTDLDDGMAALNSGAVMQMYGQIDARVLAWRHADGTERRFPGGAPSPGVVDGRFVDRIQGVEWSVPEDWRIVDYEETWPSNRLAGAVNDDGGRVDLRWIAASPWESAGEDAAAAIRARVGEWGGRSIDVGGRSGWLVERHGRAAIAVSGPAGFWLLEGESRDELQRLAAGLSLPSA
ncbi:MAG: hypothetical protein GVY32_06460 [Gammaproteobacteria bacterium]|jgi:transglutaminase-like putative cysteine protease|nr:hypothetical protein [Gammaproteobacteria bacterium]NBD95414.1 hypothetical protein [Gammaproteobacteria bacterium]